MKFDFLKIIVELLDFEKLMEPDNRKLENKVG